MSTIVNYLLAATLQFIGVSVPIQQENVSALPNHQCEEITSIHPFKFIINGEQMLHKTNN